MPLVFAPTTDKLQIVTSAAGDIDVHASGFDWTIATALSSVYRLNSNILTATTADIVAAPAAGVERTIKTVAIHNTHATVANTITVLHVGNITVDITKVTLLPGEELVMAESGVWYVYDAIGGIKSATTTASPVTTKELTADLSNSTITMAKVTGLDLAVGVGTWAFEYFIRHQAAALTTGAKFDVNHTGTVAAFLWNQLWMGSLNTTSSDAPDQDMIAALGGVLSGFASRAKGTAGRGTTLSVDTINADMFTKIEGMMIVTVAGNLELWHASEVAFISTLKAGTALRLTKLSA